MDDGPLTNEQTPKESNFARVLQRHTGRLALPRSVFPLSRKRRTKRNEAGCSVEHPASVESEARESSRLRRLAVARTTPIDAARRGLGPLMLVDGGHGTLNFLIEGYSG